MYEDLVERLRETSMDFGELDNVSAILVEAANAIEDLQKAVNFHKFNSEFWEDKYNSLADEKWISVTERLPEEKTNPNTLDFEYILCATTFGDIRAYKFGTPIGWEEPHFWNGGGIYGVMDRYVTHWMPLPEPPMEGG